MQERPLVRLDEPLDRQGSTRCQLIHALRHFEPGDEVTRELLENYLPASSWLFDLDQHQRTPELCSRMAQLAGSRRRRRHEKAPRCVAYEETPVTPDEPQETRGPERFPNCIERVARGRYQVLEDAFEPQTQEERRYGVPVPLFYRGTTDSRVTDEFVNDLRGRAAIPSGVVNDNQLRRIATETLALLEV